MLRISRSPATLLTTISLEGKLLAPWLTEVQAAVDAARAQGNVRLNLHHLHFADHDGLELLRRLKREGTDLTGASALIEGLLAAAE
jgi:CheY-like chemotaxis protein